MRGDDFHKEFVSTYYETEHPVVHVHPETGERALLLGHFVREFPGLRPYESSELFRILQERILKPDNTSAGSGPRETRDLGQPRHPALRFADFANRPVRCVTRRSVSTSVYARSHAPAR